MPARTPLTSLSLRRLAHSAPSSLATTSTGPPLETGISQTSAGGTSSRIYTPRKTYLYAYYTHLFRRSELLLLLKHDNLSVAHLGRIRNAIAKVKPPLIKSPRDGSHTPAEPAKLTIARTGILSALSRNSSMGDTLSPYLQGPTALLTCPILSPSYLSKILAAINRILRQSKREVRSDQPPPKQPELSMVVGLLEGGRLVGAKEVEEVGKFPEMATLQAQLLGLLDGPGRQLTGLLGQAGGGGLVRTLQGLEKGLEHSSTSG